MAMLTWLPASLAAGQFCPLHVGLQEAQAVPCHMAQAAPHQCLHCGNSPEQHLLQEPQLRGDVVLLQGGSHSNDGSHCIKTRQRILQQKQFDGMKGGSGSFLSPTQVTVCTHA